VGQLASAPIRRHLLTGLLSGAWDARERLRLVDALYVQLASSLAAVLITTR
jgi:predicted nucleic acid-binding protein